MAVESEGTKEKKEKEKENQIQILNFHIIIILLLCPVNYSSLKAQAPPHPFARVIFVRARTDGEVMPWIDLTK